VLRDFNCAHVGSGQQRRYQFRRLVSASPQSSDVSDARRQFSFVLGPDVVSFRYEGPGCPHENIPITFSASCEQEAQMSVRDSFCITVRLTVSPCIRLGSIIWSRPNTRSTARCLSLRSRQG
jgi:hypothetical protein